MPRILGCVVIGVILAISISGAYAQAQRTATPIIVSLVTATPLDNSLFAPIATVLPSATPQGTAVAQVPETAGNINVRSEPSLEGEILGTISHGTAYPVLRQYYSWYELRYEPSPSGRGWVYGELVDIAGDESSIEFIDDFADIGAGESGGEQGSDGVAGGSDSRIVSIVATDETGGEGEAVALPTFTRPPELPIVMPTVVSAQEGEEGVGQQELPARFPPLFPIVVLSGLGLVGLLLNSIRR